uniref:Uncharacterized protein n=1 Tax=Nelumbo nucifera TaxID=4432 RepID=A0A822XQG2_NELNU|nr:TPA_asm: hypothetical protein HUJ06_023735 [Nelumbo nucifera]
MGIGNSNWTNLGTAFGPCPMPKSAVKTLI